MKLKLLFIPRYHMDPNDYRPINPPYFPPLGISTLTGFLRQKGHNVDQDDLDIKVAHDNRFSNNPQKKVDLKVFVDQERIDRFFKTREEPVLEREAEKILEKTNLAGYDAVGFSLMPTDNPSSITVAVVLGKVLKKKYNPIILVGGSVNGEVEKQLLETGFIDYRIMGNPLNSEAEINTLDFIERFEAGKDLNKSLGATHINKSGNLTNCSKNFTEEERLMITKPDFEGLPMELYKRPMGNQINGKEVKILVIPYFFQKGCPHACAFCSQSITRGWKIKEPKEIVDELKFFKKKYKTPFFYFHNSTINPTYKFIDELADEIIKRDLKIHWSDCANFHPLDEPLIKKLKKAGCTRLVFGFESASPPVLKFLNKNFTVNQAEEVLKLTTKYKIWAELDMICGFPYETFEDNMCSVRFLEQNKPHINACSLNKFWMEGLFSKEPEKFGLEFTQHDSESHINWEVRNFREKYGLGWKEKLEQTNKSYDLIQSSISKNFQVAPDIHNLFLKVVIKKELESGRKTKN